MAGIDSGLGKIHVVFFPSVSLLSSRRTSNLILLVKRERKGILGMISNGNYGQLFSYPSAIDVPLLIPPKVEKEADCSSVLVCEFLWSGGGGGRTAGIIPFG